MNKEINEVKLSRVWKHTNDKAIPVSIITAMRDENGKDKNIANNKELAGLIKNSGYGYFWLEGHWIENQGEESEVDVIEKSIFIVGNKNDNGKLLGLVKKWMKKYNQDAVIFKPENSDDMNLVWQNGKMEKVGKFKADKISQAYSKLKNGKTFVFERAFTPLNNISKLANLVKDSNKLLK